MENLLSPEVLVLLAGSSFVLGYLIINQVLLRVFVLIGTGLYIWYYATVADEPLWEAIYTSIAMGAANIIGLISLQLRRSRIMIPREHRDIYPKFSTLPPGDFRSIIKMSRRYTAGHDIEVTTAGQDVKIVYFLISGSMDVEKFGNRFTLPSGTFVGEVAYMTGRKSAATTLLKTGSEVLEWDCDALRRKCERSSRFRLALEAMVSNDLALKVSYAVAPMELQAIMKNRESEAAEL